MYEKDQQVKGIDFIFVGDYSTFDAEYAIVGDDIVIHLFHPQDKDYPAKFWTGTFERILDKYAQEYWEATYPKLQAAYTEEYDSWWLRAFGFGKSLAPQSKVKKFFKGLDQRIDAVLEVPGSSEYALNPF